MALFKIFKGNDSAKLTDPTAAGYKTPVDGYAYYDTTSKLFYIDAAYDASNPNTITRHPINAAVAGVAGTALNGVFYGTCGTARTTERKDIILNDDTGFTVQVGTVIVVSFLNGSSSKNITMKIGSTTYFVDTYGITDIEPDTVIPFIYDGSKWYMLYAGAKTYASLAAEEDGTDESLVTTGEKYIWNNKVNRSGDVMTGNLTVSKINTASITATNTITNCSISLNAESTGAHGIYSAGYYNGSSFTNDPKWIVYRNGTNGAVLLNGTATNATSATTDASGNIFTSYYGHALNVDTVNNTISLVDANGNALGNSVSLPQSGVTALDAGPGLITNLTNNGTITGAGTIKTNLNSETPLGILGTTNKLYAVGVDVNGKLCVNVPWVGSVIQDNLTSSTNTTDALSAKQGYLLANGSARDSTKLPLAGGEMSGSITVKSTSAIDLGSSSKAWNNIYANTFNGAMSHYIDIGGKQYNGSADITIYASDLGVSSALNFAGVISETLPNMHDAGYPSTSDVHLYSNGNLVSKSSGTVVICHDTQDEFLWSEDASGNAAWYSLGLASSFALHNHSHGNILNNGAMAGTISVNNVSTSSASKAIVTDSNSNITIEDLTVSDPSVIDNANTTSFISSISQSSTGKITAVKSNISDVYVKKSGDTMTGNLYMGTTNQVNGRHLVFNGKNSDGTATRTLWMGYANDNNVWYFWDSTNNAPIIVSNNSGLGGTRFAGNADTATTLATARNINGTSFNGSANITTANWGTARNISIADSDSTNTGTAVSVNGSAAVTLKLPATIKASLNGNASTATAFSSNATVTLTGDTTGTSAGSTKSWSVSTTTNQLSFKNGRIASADLDISTMHSKMLLTLASSSMTTNKPPMGDGYIVTYGWDNSYWGAQQAISHTKTPHMAIRGTNGGSSNDWGSWIYLLDANNYTNYTVTKTGTGASGTWGINITGNSATATRATNVDYLSNATHSCSITKSSWTATNPWNMGNKTLIWGQAVRNTSLNSDSGDICLWYGTHTTPGGAGLYLTIDGGIYCLGGIYGAVWNDYAEYRKDNTKEKDIQIPGKCVREVGDGSLALTTKRLERGCEIISDTFGFAIGQDEENGYNTPIASNGRVLAYPYESIEEFASHIGYPVCSGPDGTVSIMTDEEEEKYPSRIIGTISEIPNYEEWGTGKVKVNGRVWIRIK